jgi:glycosyltransferase involved in cell wall biosynthesis
VPETAGDAALLVEDREPAVVAELIALAETDEELRGELVRRGQARVEHYAPERAATALRQAVERLS